MPFQETKMSVTTEARRASVSRATLETKISVDLCIDGSGQAEFSTGVPFLEHMLDQIARHGMMEVRSGTWWCIRCATEQC